MSSQNKFLNAWISNNTNLTGGVSLRNEGKTILTDNTTINGILTTTGGITATGTQTINFGANVPSCSGVPSTGNDLINKTYADATYHPVGSYVDISSTQTITGAKTFSANLTTTGGITATGSQTINFGANVPSCSGVPSTGNDLINKTYADASFVNLTTSQIIAGTKQFSSPPILSGANIASLSVPDSALSTNVALKNATNSFTANQTITTGNRLLLPNTNNNLYLNNSNTTNWNAGTNNCVIGQLCGANLGTGTNLNVAVGVDCLSTSSNATQCTAVGYQALKNSSGTGSIGNSAIGSYSGMSITTGSTNNGFFGTAVGNGMVTNCNHNFAMATDALSNTFSKPYAYLYYNGTEITSNTFTLTSTSAISAWATHIFVFIGQSPYNAAYKVNCSEANLSTNVLTFETNTWRLGSPTYLMIYERGAKTTAAYSSSTATGTTFTITSGLLGITGGMYVSYYETNTLNKRAIVSSYNTNTGILILTTTITLLGGSQLNFYNTTRVVGDGMNRNLCMGRGSMQNVSSGSNENVCLGAYTLNGTGTMGYDNNRFVYGNRNVAIGSGAGGLCWGNISDNIFIGYNCDVLNAKLNILTGSIGIGTNIKITKSNQIIIGDVNITKSLMIAGLIEYDNDGDQIIILNKDTDIKGQLDLWNNNIVNANITTGCTINDGCLSSNIPLINGNNTYTGATNLFTSIPTCSATYTAPTTTALITKEYADATYHPVGSYVDISSNQTITGAKTFSANLTTTGGITATGTQTINFGTNAPTMKGANITNIPDGALSSNIPLKNALNAFTPPNSTAAITVQKYGTSEIIFMNSTGDIGYWNGTNNIWTISYQGVLNCQSIYRPIITDYVRMTNANGNCIFGVNNTGSAVNDVGSNNYAFGKDSLKNITSSSNTNYSAGINVCGALTQSCQWNNGIGHNVMETGYNPASCYVQNTGATQTGVTSLVLPSIPALVKLGQTVNTYGAALNQFVATITAINFFTLTITLSSAVNCASSTYIYFYDVGYLTATYTPSSTLTGTSFTISTGLNIGSLSKCTYRTPSNTGGTAMVSSYNSSTGAIVFSTSINAASLNPMYFNDTGETAGTKIWGNTVNGTYSLNRVCSYGSFNTVMGYNSLCSSNTTPITYFGGTNNTVIGSNCGTNLKFLSSNTTLIGAGSDVDLGADGNNIQYSTAIGAGAVVNGSNQIKLGRSSETVIIPGWCDIAGQLELYNTTSGFDLLHACRVSNAEEYIYMNNAECALGVWNYAASGTHGWWIKGNGQMMLHNQYVNQGTYQNITANWNVYDVYGWFYSTYSFICNATTYTATLPVASAKNVGCEIMFRRVGGTLTTPITCTPAVWISTGTTTTTTLIAANVYIARIRCIYITASTFAWSLV